MADARWRRLGTTVLRERSRRWPRREDFAEACGVSTRVLAALENAERTNFSAATLAAIESTLGWASGSVVSILGGGDPLHEEDAEFTELRDLWPTLSPDARRIVLALVKAGVL